MQPKEWSEVKGKIKSKFGKLSDSEIEGLNGHMDRLQQKVRKAYGYTETKAKQEVKEFNESLNKDSKHKSS